MVNAVRVLLVLIVAGLFGAPTAMAAQSGDSVEQLGIDYVVNPDGTMQVTETIVYKFGPSSGRHGIIRDLTTREPAAAKDQLYDISAVTVTSPDAPAQFTQEKSVESAGRRETLRLKIGSPTQTVSAATATYVISYRVRGALRHFPDHTELYWDATGTKWDAVLNKVTVQVTVPEGVQKVQCYAGPGGSKTACTGASVAAGKGVFTQSTLAKKEGLTVVAAIKPGLVANDTPIVEDPPTVLARLGQSVPKLVGSGVVALAIPFLGFALVRRMRRDDRFVELPPGTPTGANVGARVGRDHLSERQIPVEFAPPKIAVAEGGLLFDGRTNARETAATLIDLAVRGAVRIHSDGRQQWAQYVDPTKARMPHEHVLLDRLFDGPGSTVRLRRGAGDDAQMSSAHHAMAAQVVRQVSSYNWYKRLPKIRKGAGLGWLVAVIVLSVVVGLVAAVTVLTGTANVSVNGKQVPVDDFKNFSFTYLKIMPLLLLPMLALLFTLMGVRRARRRGQRTAVGRGLTDLMIGFRRYLATAEADQLRFEEGEDIFSRYLPWAIVFELADRWQRICGQLAAAGRIPAEPSWYSGPSYYESNSTTTGFTTGMTSSFGRYGDPSSSGGGSDSSSSGFSDSGGGGGSSDSGGGGGGGSSW